MPKKLKKSSTMQQAINEGEGYLKRSWDEKKFERIQNIYNEIDSKGDKAEPKTSNIAKKRAITDDEKNSSKKPKLSKHSTMVQTAKESEILLKNVSIDTDAKTRNQSKLISKLIEKKTKLVKNRTMKATTQDSKYILQGTNIDENSKTRGQVKAKRNAELKSKLKKHSTMTGTTKEALEFLTKEPLKPRSASKKLI